MPSTEVVLCHFTPESGMFLGELSRPVAGPAESSLEVLKRKSEGECVPVLAGLRISVAGARLPVDASFPRTSCCLFFLLSNTSFWVFCVSLHNSSSSVQEL